MSFHRLQVIDDGHGLSDDERVRIFDPYFSTRGVGRGLGLSSVAGIVRSVGGFICVDSTPGKGCCFSIHLPAIEALADDVETGLKLSHKHESTLQTEPRILIVDDELLILQLQKMSLSQAGMQVTTASSAQQALLVASKVQFEFDCVVTDYSMPGQSGCWLAQQIEDSRTRPANYPVQRVRRQPYGNRS